MRLLSISSLLLLLSSAAFAGDLKVKVLDPQSAVVAGAQVILLQTDGSSPLDVATTSSDGLAILRTSGSTPLRVRVLAPGFAPVVTDVPPSQDSITVQLRLATLRLRCPS